MLQIKLIFTLLANLVLVRCYVKINPGKVIRQIPLSLIDNKNNEKYTECVISPDDLGALFGSEFICDDEADDVGDIEVLQSSEIENKEVSLEQEVNIPIQNMNELNIVLNKEVDDSSQFDDGMADYMNFLNLDRRLDMDDRNIVMKTLTMQSNADFLGLQTITPRNLTYDPLTTSKFRYDPMNFGAYKRWRDMEARVKENKQSKSKSKKKGSKQNDSFMDQIKKLGSGPAPKGTATGVGVADPPPNKLKPIQMKRSTVSRTPSSKRKVITPDDIDSLFPKSKFTTKNPDPKLQDNEQDEDDEDDDTTITSTSSSSTSELSKSSKKVFNPLDKSAIPDWILEADKEDKRRKLNKNKKKSKALTEDWRFWAAIVATAGFATAAFNIYQQTGGILERQELII